MAKPILNTKTATEEQWLEMRTNSIGGSDCATILGLNPFKSKISLWAEKTKLIQQEPIDNEAIRQGKDFEDYVAQRFTEATGKKVQKVNKMYAHDDYPFMTANVDRKVVGENSGLECKTTSVFNKYDFENGKIPPYYYCQCMHYMAVMGYDKMYLAVLVLSKEFYWFEIERNEDEINALIDAEVDFWNNYVATQTMPEIDGSDSALDGVKDIYNNREINDTVIELPENNNELVAELKTIQEQIKYLQGEENRIKANLIANLGDSEIGETSAIKVTYKAQKRTTIDSKRLQAEQPEIYNQYSKTSTTRVLRTSIKKENNDDR